MQSSEITKADKKQIVNKQKLIQQLIQIIQSFYKQLSYEAISQKVKSQIIPMLIDAYFKSSSNEIQKLQSLKQSSLANHSLKLKNISRSMIMFISIDNIVRRNKSQILSQIIAKSLLTKKLIYSLFRKSHRNYVQKVLTKFILNSRVKKLQFQAVKVFDALIKRKRNNYASYFIQKCKKLNCDIKNPEIYHDLHLLLHSFYIKSLQNSFSSLRKYTNNQNKKIGKWIIDIAALKSPINLQSSLWRVKNLSDKNKNIKKFSQIIQNFLLKKAFLRFNKKIESTKEHQVYQEQQTSYKIQQQNSLVKKKICRALKDQSVLLSVATNIIGNKIFASKLQSFMMIQRQAQQKI